MRSNGPLRGLVRRGSRRRSPRPWPADPTPRRRSRGGSPRSMPDRHRVAELLARLGRPERQHDRLAAVRLDEPDGLLDPALLVRADREAEVPSSRSPAVVGEDDPAAGQRDALDADEDLSSSRPDALVFSGSNSGRAPTTATSPGSARASTRRRASVALDARAPAAGTPCRMCLPIDGPAPALVTYERRPLASTSGVAVARARSARGRACSASLPLPEVWSSTTSVQRIAAGLLLAVAQVRRPCRRSPAP